MQPTATASQGSSLALRSKPRNESALTPAPAEGARATQGTNVGGAERIVSTLLGSALMFHAMRRSPAAALALALGAGALVHRGVTGHCYVYEAIGRKPFAGSARGGAARPQRSITIERPAGELYRMWHDPQHVSELMGDFAEVESLPDGRWRWRAHLPLGKSVEWTTTRTEDKPNELIAWRTEPDAPFVHEGSVRFRRAPRDWGTEVTLSMSFGAPGGMLSELSGKLLSSIPRVLEDQILRRCKSMVVAGEIPTLKNNPSARSRRSTSSAATSGQR